MSLLHEAFKKAERAKEEAQRPAMRTERSSVSLEIVAEPEPPREAVPLALELEPGRERSPETAAARDPQPGSSAATASIEEELRERNPKLAFHVALGAVGIAVITTAGYFWYQLRPAPAFVPSQSVRPVAALTPAVDPPARAANALLPGLPSTAAASTPQPEPVQAAAAPSQVPPPPERPASSARAPAKPATPVSQDIVDSKGSPLPPSATRATAVIHPKVQSGYAAYQAGDHAAASSDYEQALRDDAANRDALLGLAALETRARRYEQAEARYRRVLQADPRDPYAHAGLLALRAERVDPVQAESRIKTMLAADAEASVLHFTLGNQYARQGRWAEAHLAYAKAEAADAGNPDYAFNLAVSLDHLRQPAAALEHYRRALELAGTRTAHFALEAARQRVQQLSR
ncbi:MAG TPA: tetratricopeptide repeat protein [Burkholderiales bacterium]|jgi:tetratricopeptide (TPR) repeat protein|nr:tetratricopeptide repeat protein [Burkholderiales bacterium]